jgi:mannose-1-phosphate guanylyltransferase
VILSGGAGTRLWPVSREALPKPFIKLGDGRSLLRRTLDRAAKLGGGPAWLVTNRDYYFLSRDELGDDAGKVQFVLEPAARNTAPAIALATHAVAERYGEDALLLVLPADHLIDDEPGFIDCVRRAQGLAHEGWLVTFGLAARAPVTAYGYIEAGETIAAGALNGARDSGRSVRRFVEKPSQEVARDYVASGRYFWNSGMFCFRARDMLAALAQTSPALAAGARASWAASRSRHPAADAVELERESFSALDSISIDYAVFEKAARVAVVPGDFGWSDVGAWPEIAGQFDADAHGNRANGAALFVDSDDCFVYARERLVATLGLKDIVVVDTPDALLVMPRDRAQDVKKVVEAVRATGGDKHAYHVTVARPWGTYTVLQEAPWFKIKRVEVKTGCSLSLQMHHYRNEHWVVVSGTAQVTNGDDVFLLKTNESTYIPAGRKHRLENPGTQPLVLIEVQSGQYLGEDDIVRFDDRYGRVEAAKPEAKGASR